MSKIWDALQKVEQNRDGDPEQQGQPARRIELTVKQMAAVRGLLETDSLPKAAELSGVTERTLRKWLEQPAFVAAYYAAGRAQLAQSMQRLRATTGEAVEVLRAALSDKDPTVRIRAATAVLQTAAFDPTATCACDERGAEPAADES